MVLKIITANKVKNVEVVYLCSDQWSVDINKSTTSSSEQEERKLEAIAKNAVEKQVVIDPYLIEVTQQDSNIVPVRYRELIRSQGPTTNPDLKKTKHLQR